MTDWRTRDDAMASRAAEDGFRADEDTGYPSRYPRRCVCIGTGHRAHARGDRCSERDGEDLCADCRRDIQRAKERRTP